MSKIDSPIKTASEKFGDLLAIEDKQHAITFSELYKLVSSLSSRLKENNIQESTRVALYAEKSLQYIILLMALWNIKAVACPLSIRLPLDAIKKHLLHINCKVILTDKNYIENDDLCVIDIFEIYNSITSDNNNLTVSLWDLAQDTTILFTSGSTSEPKPVLHTYGNHYFNALGSNDNILLEPADRWLISLPLYHVGGLAIIFRCLLSGATMVIDNDFLIAIEKYNITHLSLVTTQLQQLLVESESDISKRQLKAILLGGGPLNITNIKKASDLGLNIFTSYGSTEMASQITTTPVRTKLSKLYTSGKILKYRELKISDDNEILVKGKTRFRGYIDGDTIKYPFDNDGWYSTGDTGFVDDEGFLIVYGRKDNMFISGGENIYPEEIEQVITSLIDIEECIVVPVEDTKFDYRPVVFIKNNKKILIDSNLLKSMLEEKLPRFKIPIHYFDWPDDINFSGVKPDRVKLKNRAIKLMMS